MEANIQNLLLNNYWYWDMYRCLPMFARNVVSSPDMTIFSKYNVMCWPKIQSFVSGVSIDFNAFLGVIFGIFILMIDVLFGGQRYIIYFDTHIYYF